MSTRFRIGILVLVVGLGIAALGFYVFTIVLRQTLAPLPQPTAKPPLTERVSAVTHDIPLGSVLKSEDIKMMDVPVELAAPGVIREAEAAIGRITKVDLMAGELIMENNLADPTNISHDIAFIIDDAQVLMAFPATDLMSTLNVLQRGDLVDIFVSVPHEVPVVAEGEQVVVQEEGAEETKTEIFTYDALQRVEITAMIVDVLVEEQETVNLPSVQGTPQPRPTPKPSEVKTRAYLLALSSQDALVLKHLLDIGAIVDLVLRSPTSNQLFELTPVSSQYLIDKYQLEIPSK